MDPAHYLSPAEEKKFYLTHNNDVQDPRYQKFVSPITDYVKAHVPPGSRGLDFGSGTGPVLWHVLREAGYAMEKFDPYFDPLIKNLERKYDFVVTSEVVEHFQQPRKEFELLLKRLGPRAPVMIMTLKYNDEIDFETWFYANDPTHVCFYREKTFDWIASNLGYKIHKKINNRFSILWAVE